MVDVSAPFMFQQSQQGLLPAPYISRGQTTAPSPHAMSRRTARRGYAPTVAQPQIQTQLTTGDQQQQQLAHTLLGGVSSAYSTAPPLAFDSTQNNALLGSHNTKWLQVPQDANISTSTAVQRADSYDSAFAAEDAWRLAPSSLVNQTFPNQQSLASRYSAAQSPPSRRLPPSIQITPHASSAFVRQQEAQISAFDSSQFRPIQQQHQAYLSLPFTTMSFDQQPQVSDIPQQHVPVSPISHHSGPSRGVSPIGEPLARKRSFSQLDQQPDHSPLDTNPSLHATSPNGLYMDEDRPVQRITRTIKRGDAPTNESNKFICTVAPECASLVFDRKCEWSKHMDKHDRPYRCPHAQCAKLQGFTYSGGLLRHEREVHNKHGGPKAFLMCPHPNCKRHTEKGFTRRENLQEHLRRVHSGKEDPSQPQLLDIAPGADLDTPASALSGQDNDEIYAALNLKRKRSDVEGQRPTFDGVDDLTSQVERLKAESDAKDAVIHRLEEDARSQNERIFALEQRLQQMQQSAA